MNLYPRFALWIGGAMGLTVTIHMLALLTSENRFLYHQADETHKTAAEHLAQVCGSSVVSGNDLIVLNFFTELARSNDFVEAMCLDEKGTIRFHSDLSQVGARAPMSIKGKTDIGHSGDGRPRWRTYTHPIHRRGTVLGAASVVFDQKRTDDAVRAVLAQTAKRSLAMTALTLGVAVILAGFAARGLTRPIRDLAAGARRLSRGDWETRVSERASGELGNLAREFNRMSKKIGDLDQLKDQVMHSVSHDLRNPLGAMTTLARMMKEDTLPATSRSYADAIETSTIRLSAMLNNILDTARLKDGPLTFHRTSVSVSKLFSELDRLYRPLAEQSQKKLVWDIPPDFPPFFADEEKLFRVMLNLLTNAFKFTRENDQISVTLRPLGSDKTEIRVTDTGGGIAPDQMVRLFEPYRAVEMKTQEQSRRQGSGLGLSIVKALVEGHGGTVRVESALGKGTIVIVTIPTTKETP